MVSDPRNDPGLGAPGPEGVAPLRDALSRAVAPTPWWRRLLSSGIPAPSGQRRGHHVDPGVPAAARRGVFPVVAALAAVLVLSLVGIAAPWNASPTPARGSSAFDPDDSVLLPSTPEPPIHPSLIGQSQDDVRTTGPTLGPPGCARPLSVVAAAEIAPLVLDLAGPLAGGSCPQLTVRSEREHTTLTTLAAGGGGAPDVWLPGSTHWLRLATSGAGEDFATSGTSVARSPVVMAVPEPVHDTFTSEEAWPVWIVFHKWATNGTIPRMSMASTATTVGALTLVAFIAAVEHHWSDAPGGGFLHMLNFRENMAAVDARPEVLFQQLRSASRAQSATRVGVFPATEQQVLAHNDQNRGARMVPVGTYEAMSEADYPMAVSRTLDDRLAGIADELRAQLRSPAAVQRFVAAGFRPPPGSTTTLGDTDRIADYSNALVPLPSPARWREILDGWTWSG